MYLYFVIMNGFARSEEVVAESALRVSRKVFILRITSSCHTMLEIIHILDVQEVFGRSLGKIQIVQDAEGERKLRSLTFVHDIACE